MLSAGGRSGPTVWRRVREGGTGLKTYMAGWWQRWSRAPVLSTLNVLAGVPQLSDQGAEITHFQVRTLNLQDLPKEGQRTSAG